MNRFPGGSSAATARSNAKWRKALLAILFGGAATAAPRAWAAAALQIAPVLLEIPAGGATTSLNIVNQDSRPAAVQFRLFRWRQSEGAETLTPTEDVVASPPIATVGPRANLTVRVIRVASGAVASEESYRLVVDQLPDNGGGGRSIVSILLRQVLPVFFEPAEPGSPDVVWSLGRVRHNYVLRARNSGGRRLRIARLALSRDGASVALGGGLFGYALAHSDMSWTLPAQRASFAAGARVTLRGDSDVGVLRASALVTAGP